MPVFGAGAALRAAIVVPFLHAAVLHFGDYRGAMTRPGRRAPQGDAPTHLPYRPGRHHHHREEGRQMEPTIERDETGTATVGEQLELFTAAELAQV